MACSTVEQCRQRFDETGVDAVIIGREASVPLVFRAAKHYLQKESISQRAIPLVSRYPEEQGVLESVERIDETRDPHKRRHLLPPLFKGILIFKPHHCHSACQYPQRTVSPYGRIPEIRWIKQFPGCNGLVKNRIDMKRF
jgi:tRNA-dihydrouridine synthase